MLDAPTFLAAEASILVGLGLYVLASWRNGFRRLLSAGLFACAWWLVCQAGQSAASAVADVPTRHLLVRVSFLGIAALPTLYALMAVRAAGFSRPVTWPTGLALAAVPLGCMGIALSTEEHRLFFDAAPNGALVPGPAYWVHVAYSFTAFIVALAIMAWSLVSERMHLSGKAALMAVAIALPPLVSVFDLASPGPPSIIDPTAPVVAVSLGMVFFVVGPLRLMEIPAADRAAAFSRSPEALVVVDEGRRVTAVSDKAAALLGRSQSALLGRTIEGLIPGSEDVFRRTPGHTVRIDVRSGQAFRQLGLKVSELPGESTAGSRVLALRDDTERNRELTAARIQYRELFDDHPQAILVHDPASLRIVSANRMAVKYYKWPVERLLEFSVAELWGGEDEAGLQLYASSTGFPLSKRAGTHRRRDGTKFEVEYRSLVTQFDGAGATVLIVEDVTDVRAAERNSARLNAFVTTTAALWRSTVDAIQAPLVVLDEGDRIFNLNRAACQALGIGVREAVGVPFARFCDKLQCQAALELARETRRTGQPTERFLDDLPDGSSCAVRASAVSRLADGEGATTVVLLQDTTAVVDLQRRLNNEAAFARLGQIVAAVAHDVRTPLASLSVNLDALAVERAGDASIEASLPALYRSINRINDLMSALLDYGRPTGEISRGGDVVDVARVAIATNAERGAGRGVTVELLGESFLKARMERGRVQQAIENLISNGIQHAPPGTSVKVEIRREGDGDAARAICRVSDMGGGFPPDVVARVFEPFYSRRQGGTGLGLAIVKRIAEQHGGAVRAENAPTGGAVVTMEWPVA